MRASLGGITVKVLGRWTEDGGKLWLLSALSEIGFTVRGGTALRIRLEADDTVLQKETDILRPRFALLVNGEVREDARMREKTRELQIALDAEKETEIRLQKLTECTQSVMAVTGIETDGETAPLAEKAERIEFIGDSITNGYGVEASDPLEQFTTETENARKSYAGLLAEHLGWDACLTAFSGHGLISGYTGDPEVRNGSELVQPYYEKAGRNGFRLPSGRLAEEIGWDFGAWQPQRIVINLGTNDLSWCQGCPERMALYTDEYVKFLKTVRKRNPGARILCILGAMGTGLNDSARAAVERYRQETGDEAVRFAPVEEQNAAVNGYGANYHPNEKSQRELAETVMRLLEEGEKDSSLRSE